MEERSSRVVQVPWKPHGYHTPMRDRKFIIRQPPTGGKDDYDSENSWISDGLPSSSRGRRRGDGRWEGGEWRE